MLTRGEDTHVFALLDKGADDAIVTKRPWFNLAVAYARKADKESSASGKAALHKQEQDAYQKTIALTPDYYKAWYNLAIAYQKSGEVDLEFATYVKALEVRPAYPQALYNLAYAYEERGATQDAIKTWRRYVSVAQRLPTEREYVQTAQAQLERLTQGASSP